MKKLILKPPSYDDLLRILSAWRVWIGGAVLGAAVASALYLIVPPAYRAQATVLVDQHVEQVIPQEQTDLRKFNYLQRETDKLLVIAWNDQTLSRVTAQTGLPVSKLRDGRLILNQPGDGGISWPTRRTLPALPGLPQPGRVLSWTRSNPNQPGSVRFCRSILLSKRISRSCGPSPWDSMYSAVHCWELPCWR